MAKIHRRKISPKQHLIERIIARLLGGRAYVKYNQRRPSLSESNAWFDDPAYGLSRRFFSNPVGRSWNKSSDDAVDSSELALLTTEQQQLISDYYKLSDQFSSIARKIEQARNKIIDSLIDQIIPDETNTSYKVVSIADKILDFIDTKLSDLLHNTTSFGGDSVLAKPKAFTPTQEYDEPIYLLTEKNGLLLIEYHLWKKEDIIQDQDYDQGKAIIDKSQSFKYSDLQGIKAFIVATSNKSGV